MRHNAVTILMNSRDPITLTQLRKKTGLKASNLSNNLKHLKELDLIIELGRKGKEKVIQANSVKAEEIINNELQTMEKFKEKMIRQVK